jgi:L-ascorbate metabolism protein UlaG (beta-lactamase superfamily)
LIGELGAVDILFLPVGEISTITVDVAAETVRQLNPSTVIPMHYKTEALVRNLEPLDKFLRKMEIREVEAKPKLSITPSSLPTSTQIVALKYI